MRKGACKRTPVPALATVLPQHGSITLGARIRIGLHDAIHMYNYNALQTVTYMASATATKHQQHDSRALRNVHTFHPQSYTSVTHKI